MMRYSDSLDRREKPTILVFVAHYLPGFKSGGPIRTIANFVDHLGDEFDLRIVTRDRDALDTEPYANIQVDAWNRVGKAEVFYASKKSTTLWGITGLLRQTPYDLLYLNSFFDFRFTALPLLARRLGLVPRKPCVVAPRGEFSKGAIALKAWKKRPYVRMSRLAGLYGGVRWQASSAGEAEDIAREFAVEPEAVAVASNLPPAFTPSVQGPWQRETESLQLVFLSRITPMKNLDFGLRTLTHVDVPVDFTIFGPVRDEVYWEQCQELMTKLPSNVTVRYHGSVTPNQVPSILAQSDLFFLPTRGENYGHVVAEALTAGTPVLIADTTPWRGLQEAGVGWDLPLGSERLFARCIEEASALTSEERREWRSTVRAFAEVRLSDPSLVDANRRLFLEAANRTNPGLR